MARVLIVGGEARAHALGWKLSQSPLVEKVYFAPGNGGTAQVGENVGIAVDDHEKLVIFAKQKKIDLTVVSPETPLVNGLADLFRAEKLAIFGPSASAAKIEGSKVFSADFMLRHNIPHPASTAVRTLAEAQAYMRNRLPQSYVIKADGLAAGKGVIVPKSQAEADAAIINIMKKQIFGDAGHSVVFQERLAGQEVSAFALADGRRFMMLPFVQDHKRVYDGDKGPNTGGMGAYSPLPFMTPELAQRISQEIIQPAINGMQADGNPYQGVLFVGLFITEDGDPKVIEFNCRFGDPECQTLMMLIDEDLYPILLASAEGKLEPRSVKLKSGAAATVCLASKGYPGQYATGQVIHGLDNKRPEDVVIFQAGTKEADDKLLTAGGRVLSVSGRGQNLKSALDKIYDQIGPKGIYFKDMHYRKDIGYRVLG